MSAKLIKTKSRALMSVILVQENPSDGARSYMYVLEKTSILELRYISNKRLQIHGELEDHCNLKQNINYSEKE